MLRWVFCFFQVVTRKPFQRAPAWIAVAVIAFVCLLRFLNPEPAERLELMTYDMRVREAARSHPAVAPNLGFVFIDEESVRAVSNGSVGFRFGLYWPRQVYGRLVDELNAQGAKAIAFDVIFGELRPD
ncbi:MAG TPA: CHASE2 domain-containing protein, partial [Verrucomicrobiae bacterium]|nr:CHASE2 domain-containing protein [Verrucomicrobiae bacterium]